MDLIEQIKSNLEEIMKNHFPKYKLRPEKLEQLAKKIMETENVTSDSKELMTLSEKHLEEYLINYLINYQKGSGCDLLKDVSHIYREVNQLFQIESNQENYNSFITLAVRLKLTSSSEEKIDFALKAQYKRLAIRQPKETKAVQPITPKKTEVPILYQEFQGDRRILYIVQSILEKSEKQLLESDSAKTNPDYQKVIRKLYQGFQVYFLIKESGISGIEVIEMIKTMHLRNSFEKDFWDLKNKFARSVGLKYFMLEHELEKIKNTDPILYHHLQLFLGNQEYNEPISEQEILKSVQKWKTYLQNNSLAISTQYSLFFHFPNVSKEHIILIVNCLKNEYPEYYEILIKYHGKDIQEKNEISEEDQKKYQNAISTVKKILKSESDNEIIVDEKDFIFLKNNKTSVKNQKDNHNNLLLVSLPTFSEKGIKSLLEKWKETQPEYYKIIIKVYGPTLSEWNFWELSTTEKIQYDNAITQLEKELIQNKTQTIEPKKEPAKRGSNLLERLPEFSEEEIRSVLNNWQPKKPKYYEIIIRVYGTSFKEYNMKKVKKSEIHLINNAVTQLKKELIQNKTQTLDPKKAKTKKGSNLLERLPEFSEEEIRSVLNTWKQTRPKYYKIIMKVYGPSFKEHNTKDLKKSERKNLLNSAFVRLKLELTRNKTQTLDPKKEYTKRVNNLLERLPEYSEEEIRSILNTWQQTRPKYYEIIIRVYSASFKEHNTKKLEKVERNLLNNAVALLRKELLFIKENHQPKVEKLNKNQKSNNTLYEQLNMSKYELDKIMKTLKKEKTELYELVIKQHGDDYATCHRLPKEKEILYQEALRIIQQKYQQMIDQKEYLKKNWLLNKRDLAIIKAKRRKVAPDILIQTFHITLNELYQIYANNILLFGDQIPNVIEEIIFSSSAGINYLQASAQFQYLMSTMNNTDINTWIEQLIEKKQKEIEKEQEVIQRIRNLQE